MGIKGRKLAIIGASGQGKVVADIARLNDYQEIVFFDDNITGAISSYPVIGRSGDDIPKEYAIFVAIGNAEIRKMLMEHFDNHDIPVLIHPSAVVAEGVQIGVGTVVMAGAVINPCTQIGKGCIINTCSSVDHDCRLGDYVHVAVGAHLCGTVVIGDTCWVGAGAVISNNIRVCGSCVIGAGAVVIRNIDDKGTYIGVPTYKLKE